MLYIIIAILMFGFLIAIHEFGHFITAKMLGVRVNEFSIGMGPQLWSKQKGETQYSLRILPIGGYCAMEGEDIGTDDPRSFHNKAPWRKVIILVAGSFMNFLTGFVILLVLGAVMEVPSPVVTDFLEGFPAEQVELQAGDRIVEIEGHAVRFRADVDRWLDEAAADGSVDLVVERGGEEVALKGQPLIRRPFQLDGEEKQMFGLYFGAVEHLGPGNVLRYAWMQSVEFVKLVWTSLGQLVRGAVGVTDMTGPVGIVDAITEVGTSSPSTSIAMQNVFYFIAFIAINLAVMNMLPIPALDGGRIFFLVVNLLYTGITKKKLDPKYENAVNMAGLFCLLALMAVVAINDIFRLFR